MLQLGMGDAFDDWLIEKIQLLRKGSVVASGIRRIEQVILTPYVMCNFQIFQIYITDILLSQAY